MKTKWQKKLALGAALAALALAVSACSGGGRNDAASASPSATATPASTSAAAGVSTSAPASASEDSAAQSELSGVFDGLVDGHTVEIKTGAGPVSYQISPEIADKVADWEPGTNVKIKYKENTILSIDKE